MRVHRLLVIATIVLAACGISSDPSNSSDPPRLAGSVPVGWMFADAVVPKGIDPPVVGGGLVINSYRGADRVVATLVYESAARDEIVSVYHEWSTDRDGTKSGRGFDVQGRVAWQDSWHTGDSEVRMSECLNELSGEFDNLCVALTTWVGSVP